MQRITKQFLLYFWLETSNKYYIIQNDMCIQSNTVISLYLHSLV